MNTKTYELNDTEALNYLKRCGLCDIAPNKLIGFANEFGLTVTDTSIGFVGNTVTDASWEVAKLDGSYSKEYTTENKKQLAQDIYNSIIESAKELDLIKKVDTIIYPFKTNEYLNILKQFDISEKVLGWMAHYNITIDKLELTNNVIQLTLKYEIMEDTIEYETITVQLAEISITLNKVLGMTTKKIVDEKLEWIEFQKAMD